MDTPHLLIGQECLVDRGKSNSQYKTAKNDFVDWRRSNVHQEVSIEDALIAITMPLIWRNIVQRADNLPDISESAVFSLSRIVFPYVRGVPYPGAAGYKKNGTEKMAPCLDSRIVWRSMDGPQAHSQSKPQPRRGSCPGGRQHPPQRSPRSAVFRAKCGGHRIRRNGLTPVQ